MREVQIGEYGEITEQFLGVCIGVRVQDRSEKDHHQMITLMVEDDGEWYESSFTVDTYWLDETIEKLKTARKYLRENHTKTKHGFDRKAEVYI